MELISLIDNTTDEVQNVLARPNTLFQRGDERRFPIRNAIPPVLNTRSDDGAAFLLPETSHKTRSASSSSKSAFGLFPDASTKGPKTRSKSWNAHLMEKAMAESTESNSESSQKIATRHDSCITNDT